MREFYRWTDAPQQPPSSPVLASIAVVWCAGLPWFREQELLALFGLTTIDHPDRFCRECSVRDSAQRRGCSTQPPRGAAEWAASAQGLD